MAAASDPFERVKAVVDARPGLVDAVVAAVAVVTGLLTTTAKSAGDVVYEPRDGRALALVLLATVPLVFRSRAPAAVLVGCSASVVTLSALGYAEGVLPVWLWVVAATVGSRRSLRTVLWCGAYVMIALVALLASNRGGLSFTGYLSQVAMFSTAFAIGYSMQARRGRLTALEERSQALEAGQEAAAQRAVAHERLRIAQELHDVVAHSMSVIAVQAGTGAHVIDNDPEAARHALDAIADTSRSSLAELRALLGVLRGDDGRPDYAPAPGLADLDHLVGEVRAAGVPVELTVEGDTADVPPGAALAAYRIVQEALTNVLKHAGPASARVRITRAPGALDLEVTDDGRGATVTPEPSGHGLVGMRERVAVYGGHLDAGPATAGGFRVRAHVPLGEVAP